MLSRNFRLQRVGNLNWLQRNYDFSSIAFYIDELLVLDVSREDRSSKDFCEMLKSLTEGCFVPIAAGGGIRTVDAARQLLRSGADKVVVNTASFNSPELLLGLAKEFGQQCVICSVDIRNEPEGYRILTMNGTRKIEMTVKDALGHLPSGVVGELYLNSIDRDGTGQGYDFSLLEQLPSGWTSPVILAGGVGNSSHLKAGLLHPQVDAVATAHLFNFIGDGLKNARTDLLHEGLSLAFWPPLAELTSSK